MPEPRKKNAPMQEAEIALAGGKENTEPLKEIFDWGREFERHSMDLESGFELNWKGVARAATRELSIRVNGKKLATVKDFKKIVEKNTLKERLPEQPPKEKVLFAKSLNDLFFQIYRKLIEKAGEEAADTYALQIRKILPMTFAEMERKILETKKSEDLI